MTRKQSISARKRYALWRAHAGKCFYCGEPIRYAEVWVNHILPESLLNERQQLRLLLKNYGLEQYFDINGYGNCLPSDARCNLRKGNIVFERNVTLYYVSIAQSKENAARVEEEKSIRNLKADKLLNSLHIALDEGLISKSDIQYIVSSSPVINEEPIVITFGLLIETVLNSDQLPDNVSTYYPQLCEWLESDLMRHLQSIFSCGFFYTEASLRPGKSLSVRLAFGDFDENELATFVSPWWDILEIDAYSNLYDEA